nr:MAG TPA: hypothetical protein [Caudoviricetes sp.]
MLIIEFLRCKKFATEQFTKEFIGARVRKIEIRLV